MSKSPPSTAAARRWCQCSYYRERERLTPPYLEDHEGELGRRPLPSFVRLALVPLDYRVLFTRPVVAVK